MKNPEGKIRILIPMRYPVGGIRTYLKYTYGRLDLAKYSFTFLGSSEDWLERIREDLSEYDVDIIYSQKDGSNISFLVSIGAALFKRKFDIIHSQGYTAGILSSIANFAFRLPHIITLHRVFGHDKVSHSFWNSYTTTKRIIIELLLKRADVIQSVSNDAKANLLEYFPGLIKNSKRLKVILNGINIDEFDIPNDSNEHIFMREPGIFYIGYFGRYMPEKGFTHLIDMVELLVKEYNVTNITIVSVGGFGAYIREYQKEIKKRELEAHFQFLGFFKNVAPVLKKIDLLIIPSLSEACGLISMEGLVCGTPTLAYSCIGLREVLHDTPAVMVQVGDTGDLANQIISIMSDYKRFKHDFDDFVPMARQRFDSIHTASELEKVFDKLIHDKAFK